MPPLSTHLLHPSDPDPSARPTHALIIHDVEAIGEQVKDIVATHFKRVDTVSEVEHALRMLEGERPDVVIIGASSRRCSVDRISSVRASAGSVPIVVVSDTDTERLMADALEAGADSYLSPPITRTALLREICRSIKAARAEMTSQMLSMVFETTHQGIVITDSANKIIHINRAFTEITGYTADDVMGKDPKILNSGRQDAEFYRAMWSALRERGAWSGEIYNRRKSGELYPELLNVRVITDESGAPIYHVGVFSDITRRKEAEARAHHLAHHDPLTDLPNRLLFFDRLQQAILQAKQYSHGCAVLVVDINRFKVINEALGHNVGDAILRESAARIVGCVRESDTVSRHGGDEFILLLPEVTRSEEVVAVAQKVSAALMRPFVVEGHELLLTSSIGISVSPQDGSDAESLIQRAEIAMYKAKEAGPSAYRFYLPEMDSRSFERLTLETSLRRALERRQLEVYYQPKVSGRSQRILGMEALVRWRHPELGLVSPADFIPLAEETGLIVPIGEWVLRTAAAQVRAWQDEGLPPLRVAVNVSARQLCQPGFVERVRSVLEETGLDPALLELELTESLLMRRGEATAATLGELKAMGVRIAIDDFGTGYSSLSYLKRLPVDTLKIDKSFLSDVGTPGGDAALVDAIISMAHRLSLHVVAEGVETEEQERLLGAMGCDELQGYRYSPPVPAGTFRGMVASAAFKEGAMAAVR